MIYLGRPFFHLIVFFVTLLYLLRPPQLPRLPLSKIHLPKPSLPRLNLPQFTFPRPAFNLPPLSLPSLSLTLPPLPRFTFSFTFNLRPFLTSLILIVFFLASFSSFFYFWIIKDLPSPTKLASYSPQQSTQIYDRHGQLLYRIYEDENRTLIHLTDLPDHVKQATLSIEDKSFYLHQGISLSGIIRAVERNLTSHQIQGGSTITQQLIKNTLLSREKTLARKIKEIILAIQTELLYSKDTIFEMYLNQVAYGGTAYGIQAAAQQYFGLDASQLNLAQAALLAGLPQAPTKYSPFGEYSPLAKQRQLAVLTRMVEDGYITKSEAQAASSQPLDYISPATSIRAPHFVMYVKDLLVNQFGEDLVTKGGLQVYTTLDLSIQDAAETEISRELDRLGNYRVSNAAALVTKPATGEILAMVGSKNYFDVKNDGQVNLTTALRQPGSAVKPINYALAFEKGATPATIIEDSPITFSTPGSPPWSPKNYDFRYHGKLSLRSALANSYNVPAVKLLAQNGASQMVALAQQLGITTWNDPARHGLSLTLGSLEVKMTDLAEAYGTFANLGRHVELNPILNILDSTGQPLIFSPCASPTLAPNTVQAALLDCSPYQALTPQTAYLITDILSDPLARAPAFGLNSILRLSVPAAVKTGTSNDLRDNWTIGYTSDYLVATWVGNNDNTSMNRIASGITGASPIWNRLLTHLSKLQPPTAFATPANIVKVAICPLTNSLACPTCPNPRTETFISGTQPTTTCTPQQIQQALLPLLPSLSPTPQILTGISTSR